ILAVAIFAAAATVIDAERRAVLVRFFDAVNAMAMVVIGWVMQLAPAAVVVLVSAAIARAGAELLAQLVMFASAVVIALLLHVALVLLPAMRFAADQPIAPFFRKTADAVMFAFSTASSSATLPVSMTSARERLGVPAEIVAFVLPLGATINKNGAAVYKAVTAVFIAKLYGVALGPATLAMYGLKSTLDAFAGGDVPGR